MPSSCLRSSSTLYSSCDLGIVMVRGEAVTVMLYGGDDVTNLTLEGYRIESLDHKFFGIERRKKWVTT